MGAQRSIPSTNPVKVEYFTATTAPTVYLRSDPDSVGRVFERGPSQSLVRWPNGNERYCINDWLVEIEGEATGPLAPKGRTSTPPQVSKEATPAQPSTPKRKPPPDRLGNQVAEHCDDLEALRRFALANDCWDDKYSKLPNPGLVRMNVVNRLRARVRKGHEVVWS